MDKKKISFWRFLIIQFLIIVTFLFYFLVMNDYHYYIRHLNSRSNVTSSLKTFNTLLNESSNPNTIVQKKQMKLFCFILSSGKNCMNGKAKQIYNAWAHKCDNYKFISVIPEEIRLKNQSYITENGTEFNNGFEIMQPPGLGTKVNDTYEKVSILILK